MALIAVDEGSTVSDFETSMTSFVAMTIGGFAVVALIISLGAERFPADRRRYAPWPLTVAASAGTTTVVSTSFGNSAATWPMLGSAFGSGSPMLFIGLIPAFKFEADRVRVTVGPAGLIIRNGLTRGIEYAVGLQHINSAWFTDAPKPQLWGSYGKQSSSKRLSFFSRKGPALLVRLTDGTDIVVALDRPEEAAGIVNDLLDRRISSPSAATLR